MTPMLSRAKIKDTGYWIEGYYACESNHACFQKDMKYTHFIFKDEFMDWGIGGLVQYEVIPETVGRYTGLTDKNGERIFEGDICEDSIGCKFVVEWDEINARFIGRTIRGYNKFEVLVLGGYIAYIDKEPKVEVVSNIHDNPELLKGGAV